MTDQHKGIVRRFIDETDRDGSPPGHLVTDDFAAHFPGLPNLTFDEYRSMTESAYAALEGLRHHIHELIAEGDRVVYRSTNVGRHVGEIAGVAATGNEVSITSLAEFRFEDGRIAEVWVEMDILSLTRQTGAARGWGRVLP